jgi:uncharacterized protein YaiL (DUF2058 family)
MSLRDQLLKAGLVTEKQVRQATQSQAKQTPSRHKPPVLTPPQRAAQQAQAEKAARDQALNLKKQQKAERKARAAEVNQLVEQYRVPKIDSDDYFNFIHRDTVERIAVDAPTRQRIGSGELLIVRYRGHYALVPASEAGRIRERDAEAVITLPAAPVSVDPADPYKDFVVPDDLMW